MVMINAFFLLIISIDYYQYLLVMCVVRSTVAFHPGIYCVLAASGPPAALSAFPPSTPFCPPISQQFPYNFSSTLFILEFTYEQNMKCMSSCICLTLLNTVASNPIHFPVYDMFLFSLMAD